MLLLLCIFSFSANANEKEMRRIMVGLKLFPAVIAADTQLAKKIDTQGNLSIYILYDDDAKLANNLAKRLTVVNKIKTIPISLKVTTYDDFINNGTSSAIAAFLAQTPNNKTQELLHRAISSSTLLFSPFKGDVEKGVHSGFIVSDRILPYVNLKTMQQSRIQLKAFFLRVSKHYD